MAKSSPSVAKTSQDVHGEMFPICHTDVTGRPWRRVPHLSHRRHRTSMAKSSPSVNRRHRTSMAKCSPSVIQTSQDGPWRRVSRLTSQDVHGEVFPICHTDGHRTSMAKSSPSERGTTSIVKCFPSVTKT